MTSIAMVNTQLSNKELLQNVAVERISPALAKTFLANMGPQRQPRPAKIAQYADDMRRGKWVFNGSSIVFDRQGKLRDGQNRMLALIKANVTLPFLVIRNASEDVIATIDTGMSRTFADVNHIQGVPNATDVGAAATWWWKYENNLMTRLDRTSHQQLAEVRDRHLNSIDQAIRMVKSAKTARAICYKSLLNFVTSYLIERAPNEAEKFLHLMDTGLGLTEKDPVFVLRRLLTNNLAKRAKIPTHMTMALVIKAFNYQYLHREIINLIYRQDEEFPKFVV
jgi:hypothetical protein